MENFSQNKIKCHPSIIFIFVPFLIMANIYEPLQYITQMKRYIKILITKSYRHHIMMTKLQEWREAGGRTLGEPTELSRPSINLVIQELIPDHNGFLQIGVVVADDFPTWETVLSSLGYQLFWIHYPVRFRKFLQGSYLIVSECLPPNQVKRLSNFTRYLGFCAR